MKDSIQMTKIPELRQEYLILNSAGLNILCRIGHYIIQDDERYQFLNDYIERLSTIDWKKNAPIWKGNIVQEGAKGDKISTANSTIKAAVKKVKETIMLDAQPSTMQLL